MRVDHVAIITNDIAQTAQWYIDHFQAKVLYQDSTWAFLQLGGIKLALVTPGKHPGHLAFAVTPDHLQELAEKYGQTIKPHRDGTTSFYISDPANNYVEFIAYPPGHVYQKSEGRIRVHPTMGGTPTI